MKGRIYGIIKWRPLSRVGTYLGHSTFHSGSVTLVINPETGHVSPQFHVVFDDEFYTVPFIREGVITPNWTDLVQRRLHSGAPDYIGLKNTWFTPDLEEHPS